VLTKEASKQLASSNQKKNNNQLEGKTIYNHARGGILH